MGDLSSELPVPDVLRGWVDRIEVASYRPGRFPLVNAPDPATVLLWRTTADGHGDVLVLGPRTQARYPGPKDLPGCVRWQLGAGAARTLLGTSPADLVDRVVPLAELWGSAAGFTGPASRPGVARLTAALADRAETAPPDVRLVRRAGRELAGPRPRVAEVARRVGVSERHLRTVFTAAVGLSPKQFARLTRLRTILPAVRSGSLARLASEAGYYDQSHMTAQFREFMRVTPTEFADGRVPTAAC